MCSRINEGYYQKFVLGSPFEYPNNEYDDIYWDMLMHAASRVNLYESKNEGIRGWR